MKTAFDKARARFVKNAAPLVVNCTAAEVLAYAFNQGVVWRDRNLRWKAKRLEREEKAK